MNPFFAYLIKSSVSLVLLYSLFRLVMRNDRTHALNRFLLLGILLVSAIIPFLNIQFFYEEATIKQVEVFREFVAPPVFAETVMTETVQPIIESRSSSVNPWLAFYILVISALVFRLVLGVIKVMQIINRAEKRRLRKIVLAVVQDLIEPFTFLNKVVLSEKDFTENKNIIVAHEHAHIKQLHTIDLMVCEVFTVMHFFNPFMWLLRRDLKLIHEYQADQAVLDKGIDEKEYQLLVLQKSVGERRFAMANHFTQKPILKRLQMMQKKNRKQWAALKLILFLPLLVILLQAFARPELITKTEDFIPIKYTESQTEKWLAKWTVENIGKGFYDPELDDIDAPRKGNNVLVILMNARNEYLIENQYPADKSVKQIVKDYLHGVNPDGKNGPDFIETEIPEIGKIKISKGIISYRYDIDSSKEMVNKTLRAIGEACLEVRSDKAKLFFDENYFDLSSEKREAIDKAVPVWFTTENPKGPTPSVWLPFDGKPSPEPEPIQIKVKSNGEVYAENHKYNSYDSFKENVLEWKADLDKYNKKRRSKAFYRAHITYEAEVPRAEQKELNLFLEKNEVHIEWIKEDLPVKLPLQTDKLKERASQESNDSDVELFIPEGISPNNDGIHDFFIIKGIYPKYPDAKLLVFSENGEKLYEQEQYGNTNVWGKDKVWWSGSSNNKSALESDGKLPAGNYNYVLELGNGEKKSGTILLAKSQLKADTSEDIPPIHIKIMQGGKLFWGEPNAPFSGNNKGYYVWKDQVTLKQFQEKVQERKTVWSKENPTKELTAFVVIEKNASKINLANVKIVLEQAKIYKISYSGESNVLPVVMIHKNWVSYDWRTCEIEDLYTKVQAGVKNKQPKTVEVQVHEGTPNEKVEKVYSELNRIQDLRIIRNKVSPPPPPPPPKVVEVL